MIGMHVGLKWGAIAGLVCMLGACGSSGDGGEGSSTGTAESSGGPASSSSGGSSGVAESSSSVGATSTSSTGVADGSSGGSSSTGVELPEDCDPFAQDCPAGFKCAPISSDGSPTWDDTLCVPVVDEPVGFGEACTMEKNPFSGLDDCGVGAMCLVDDQDALSGECIELCGGTPAEPTCEQADASCLISATGALAPCLLSCNPLEDDCDADERCIPGGDSFICTTDASGKAGALGDTCEFPSACDPGLGCFTPTPVVCDEPEGVGCCLPYCSLAAPDCPDGLACTPFWMEGDAPEGFEDVGICHEPK